MSLSFFSLPVLAHATHTAESEYCLMGSMADGLDAELLIRLAKNSLQP